MRAHPFVGGIMLLGAVFSIMSLVLMFQMPSLVKNKAENLIRASGFDFANIQNSTIRLGSIKYENIELDEKGFSTIKSLKIEYSWLDLLLFDHVTKITIDGLNLTGELSADQKISVSGWNPENIGNLLSHTFITRNIIFKNAQASLLSKNFGGISIAGEVETSLNEGGFAFRGKLSNTQKHMRYSTKFNGQFNQSRAWNSTIAIEEIRLDLPHLKATRASGEIKAFAEANKTANLSGEIRAGNMTIAGFPWKNTAITLQGNPTSPSAIIAAKAQSFEKIELGMALKNIYEANELSGYIYAEKLGELFDYLKQHKALPVSRNTLSTLNELPSTEINFEKFYDALEFNISNKALELNLDGFTQFFKIDENAPIPNIALESKQPGIIKITNPEFFKRIETNNSKNKALIQSALKDLRYTKLVVRLLNKEGNTFKFKINISGSSPHVENGRAFKTDFSLTSDLETLTKIILKGNQG